jgi:N-acetylmuramoyl-L-alanine amidase
MWFLSNAEEREKLKTPAYQQQLAFAVMAGYWHYQSLK